MKALPIILLLVGSFRHYGWAHAPEALAGITSKGLGGAASLCLLAVIWGLAKDCRSKALAAVMAWYAFEDSLIVSCSALYAWRPWPVPQGKALCSAGAGIEFGAVGILIVAGLLWYLVSSYSVKSSSERVR